MITDPEARRNLYIEVLKILARCGELFTRPELEVISFINERTLRFNKRLERIPLRVFLEGAACSNGLLVSSVSYSRNVVNKACHTLSEKGYISIFKHKTPYCEVNAFRINTDKLFDDANEISERHAILHKLKTGIKESCDDEDLLEQSQFILRNYNLFMGIMPRYKCIDEFLYSDEFIRILHDTGAKLQPEDFT